MIVTGLGLFRFRPEALNPAPRQPPGGVLIGTPIFYRHDYLFGMSSAPKKRPPSKRPAAAKLRSWRVSILRQRAQRLGDVEAPDAKSAEVAAVAQFNLSEEQRKRLVVQERD